MINREPERGISHSLQLGLTECLRQNPDLRGVLCMVCDQPYLEPGDHGKTSGGGLFLSRGYRLRRTRGRRGNPVLWDKCYFPELLSLTGDTGGRQMIKRYPENVRLVECGEKELKDVDIRAE